MAPGSQLPGTPATGTHQYPGHFHCQWLLRVAPGSQPTDSHATATFHRLWHEAPSALRLGFHASDSEAPPMSHCQGL